MAFRSVMFPKAASIFEESVSSPVALKHTHTHTHTQTQHDCRALMTINICNYTVITVTFFNTVSSSCPCREALLEQNPLSLSVTVNKTVAHANMWL